MKTLLRTHIKTVIYFAITAIIMVLQLMNMSEKEYYIYVPELTTEQYTDEAGFEHNEFFTDKVTLTKGTYRFVVNYVTSRAAKIEICAGRKVLYSGTLVANTDSGYHEIKLQLDESTSEFFFRITDPEGLQIYNYEIIKDGIIVYDDIYYSVMILIFSIVIYLILSRYHNGFMDNNRLISLLSTVAIIIFVSSPTLNKYLIWGFDIEFHMSRIEGIKDAFLDGQIIPFIYPNCNNGYGVLGFVYPELFLVPSALLRLCNISMVAAYHFFVIMVNTLTVIIAWVSSRSFTKSDRISLLCVFLCACNPLRLTSLYQSASAGEVLGMAFIPLAFAGLYEIIHGDRKKWYYLTIAYSGILMSHVLSCLIVAVVSILIILPHLKELMDRKEQRYKKLVLSISVFVLANLWFIILFIIFYKYRLNTDSIATLNYYKETIIPTKLFMTSTSNNGVPQADKGILDGVIQGPGITGLMCIFIVLILIQIKDSNHTEKKWFGISIAIIMGFMYISTTMFPWYMLGKIDLINRVMETIQYPHRFYDEISPIIFIVGPVAVERIMKKPTTDSIRSLIWVGVLAVMSIFALISVYTVMNTYNVQTPFKTEFSGGYASYPLKEYLPDNTDTSIFENTEPHNFGSETIHFEQNGTHAFLECKTYDEGAYVLLPLLYYPFYNAVDENGAKYNIQRSPDGRIQIFLPVSDDVLKIYVNYM